MEEPLKISKFLMSNLTQWYVSSISILMLIWTTLQMRVWNPILSDMFEDNENVLENHRQNQVSFNPKAPFTYICTSLGPNCFGQVQIFFVGSIDTEHSSVSRDMLLCSVSISFWTK